ncbi:helix-turn-helix transcriptional regulator [Polymorphobacter sp.]|uniref:helix-turn-helix transcriptional regulator n=1 Tax=Polymorphobacter sp. TaxID=1909290 RepID=UPI003F6EBF5C
MIVGQTSHHLPHFNAQPEQFTLTRRFRSASLVREHGTAGGMAMPIAHWRSRLEDDAFTPGFSHHSIILQNAGSDARRTDSPRFAARRSAPGRIIVMPAGMQAKWRSPSISDRLHFYLRPELLDMVAAELEMPAPQLRDDRVFVVDEALRALLERYARNLLLGDGSALERDLLTIEIVVCLLRRHADAGAWQPPEARLTPCQQQALRDMIERHPDQPLDLGTIARAVGCSPVTLKRGARAALGMSLHQFVIERRLVHAAGQIVAGRPIVDAALASGFSSQSHLTSQMRKRWGCTPGALRQSRI